MTDDYINEQQRLIAEQSRQVLLALLNALAHMDYPGSAETIFSDAASTGFQGGDAGHGGHASVTFTENAGTIDVELDQTNGQIVGFESVSKVTITARGDWEQTDLLRGLIRSAVVIARELYGPGVELSSPS